MRNSERSEENICKNCGENNSEFASYCFQCGFPLSGSIEDVDEKRIVTVLFADLVGFTGLSEEVGAEMIKEIIGESLNVISSKVKRYGGYINKFLGDGVMAIFGAPRMIENHAEKALLAGYDIQKSIEELSKSFGRDIKFRIGVHTGEVVSGIVGTEDVKDYTILGDAVNVASRLEGKSEPGKVLTSSDTFNLTREFFEFDFYGELDLKGKTEKVVSYFVVAPKEVRGKIRGIKAIDTPMIGRDDELRKLIDNYNYVKNNCRLRAVLIEGNAGVGKTRLYEEFVKRISSEAITDDYLILSGRCLPYGAQSPYLPFVNAFMDYFDVSSSDNEVEINKKVNNKLDALELSRVDRINISDVMLKLFQADSEIEMREEIGHQDAYERISLSLGILLDKISKKQTVIFSFEDIHWIDETSLNLLVYLCKFLSKRPIYFIFITRPYIINRESYDDLIGYLKDKDLLIELMLMELNNEEILELLGFLLHKLETPENNIDNIITSCGGNPFFLEELIKYFIETGILKKIGDIWKLEGEIKLENIPLSIEEVILARVDKLDMISKRILQRASVFGRKFWKSAIIDMLGLEENETFDDLIKTELIVQEEKSSLIGDIEYSFRHDLLQEVIYQSLLDKYRKNLHLNLADWLENKIKDNQEPFYYLLAYHFERGDNRSKAIENYEKAGDWFWRNFSHNEAIKNYEKALTLLKDIPDYHEIMLRIMRSLGDVYQWSGRNIKAIEIYDYILTELKDKKKKAEILKNKGICYGMMGERDQTLDSFLNALDIIKELPVLDITINLFNDIAYYSYRWDDMKNAKEYGERAFELLNDFETADKELFNKVSVNTYNTIAIIKAVSKEYREARELARMALNLAEEIGLISEIVKASNTLSNISYEISDLGNAITYIRRALTNARLIGKMDSIIHSLINLGSYYSTINMDKVAIESLNEALELSLRINYPMATGMVYTNIAEIFMNQGRFDEALALAKKSCDIFISVRDEQSAILIQLFIFKILIKLENWKEIYQYREELNKTVKDISSPFISFRFYVLLLEYYSKLFKLNSNDENFRKLKESVNKVCQLYEKLKPGLIPIVIINPRYWIALGLFLLGEIDEASGFIEQNLNVIDRVSKSINEDELEQFNKSEMYIKNNELMKKIEYLRGKNNDWK